MASYCFIRRLLLLLLLVRLLLLLLLLLRMQALPLPWAASDQPPRCRRRRRRRRRRKIFTPRKATARCRRPTYESLLLPHCLRSIGVCDTCGALHIFAGRRLLAARAPADPDSPYAKRRPPQRRATKCSALQCPQRPLQLDTSAAKKPRYVFVCKRAVGTCA